MRDGLTCLVIALASWLQVTAKVDWSSLVQRDSDFAQMVEALKTLGYQFSFANIRDNRVADVYLVSAVGVVPSTNVVQDEKYFATEKPAAGLVTSVLSERQLPRPFEHLLVFLRIVSTGVGNFRCDQFAQGQRLSRQCEGEFNFQSGALKFTYLDTLVERTASRFQQAPKADCVAHVYETERKSFQCGDKNPAENLRCSLASFLYARSKCRTGLSQQ
jgi:hypothetical protein